MAFQSARTRGRGRSVANQAEGPSDGGADGAERPVRDPAELEADARAICLRALTGAPRSRAQLAEVLARKDVPDDVAEAVLDRLGEVGLVDDAAYARAWVSSRQGGRGLARRALGAELRAKGVVGEDADQALALVDDQDEWDGARRLVARRLSGLQRVDRETATRRLMGMLARKGYGGGLAAVVVREALDGVAGEDDPDDDSATDARDDAGHDTGIVPRRSGSGAHPELGLDAFLP